MKKQSKSQQILAMLDKGMAVALIAEKVNVKPAYVYSVKSEAKKRGSKTKPLHSVTPTTNKVVMVKPVVTVKPDETQVGGDHYKDNKIQVWDAIHDWGLGYFSGNVVKYVARHQKKNGVEDLKEARRYLDKLIAMSEKRGKGT
jgi:hypothetical protein